MKQEKYSNIEISQHYHHNQVLSKEVGCG